MLGKKHKDTPRIPERRLEPVSVLNAILETIPQLYEAEKSPIRKTFRMGEAEVSRCSLRELGPPLVRYVEECIAHFNQLQINGIAALPRVLRHENLQQLCATLWLESQTGINTWDRILDYFLRVEKRTIENLSVPKSFIIDPAFKVPNGSEYTEKIDFFDKGNQKLLDGLATSPFTFFRVTPNLEFISYEAISQPKEDFSPDYIPDFLWPMASQISRSGDSDKALLADSNSSGDLLISDRCHILASRVKGRWTVYDPESLRPAMQNCLAQGKNIEDSKSLKHLTHTLFRVLFDVSFRRQGGLIIIDKNLDCAKRYVHSGVLIDKASQFTEIIPKESYGEKFLDVTTIRKFIELTAIDGAVILSSDGQMLGYGAIITPHPEITTASGARLLAAKSAARYGAIAFSVSADGEILIHFKTPDFTGDAVHAMRL